MTCVAGNGSGLRDCRLSRGFLASVADKADEVVGHRPAHFLFPMPAAERDIDVLADRHLLALLRHLAVGTEAHDHRRLTATTADGAHLAQIVGDGKQRARTGKQLALEIGAQAVAHDRMFSRSAMRASCQTCSSSRNCASSTKMQCTV